MSIKVISMKAPGWKRASFMVIRIDRQTIFGNPFIIGTDGDRGEVIAKYRDYMHNEYASGGEYMRKMNSLAVLAKHAQISLACWCSPMACHGDEIVTFINHLNSMEE